ncbi:hypothetical protein KHP62_00880 [Rhodobacteraceae bacterium NNCM2]|nr:hypothetical protein [Coraliihabitans acroporae]
MTPDDIQKLVDEEIARRHAENRLPEPNDSLRWLRHPLMITLVGFLLTTVIGSFYDGQLKEREDKRLSDAREVETARRHEAEAMRDLRSFVQLAYERQVRTDLVRSAIARGMQEEAIPRKKVYDEIYTSWNIELYPRLLNLRSLVGRDLDHSPYEKALETTVLPSFSRSDACLTVAYDAAFRAGFPYPAPNDRITASGRCGDGGNWQAYMKEERNNLRICLNAILSNMVPQIRARAATVLDPPLSEAERAKRENRIEIDLARACNGMTAPEPIELDTDQ